MSQVIPMFPLGTVLFPYMVLPLHIFEERYRTMMRDLDEDGTFGVALIERGHEVGGGDVRVDWGTNLRIVDAEELEDGRWVVIGVGTRRLRIARWLPDAPYPRAEVEAWDDPAPGPEAAALRERAARRLRRVIALETELGDASLSVADAELTDDPTAASYQASVLAPVGPLDGLRLLRAETPEARFRLLLELLDEREDLLRLQLGEGTDGGGPPRTG